MLALVAHERSARRELVDRQVHLAIDRVPVRLAELVLLGADVEVELAREAGVEEAVVGEDARDGGEDLAFAEGRGFVVLFAADVLQLDRELRGAWCQLRNARKLMGEHTFNVAFVLLCLSRYLRVTGPASAYSAKFR